MDWSVVLVFFGILFLLPIIVGLATALSMRRVQRKLANKQVIINEYQSPKNLSAAEIGYLFDRRFGDNELLASIISLYQMKLLDVKPLIGNNFEITINKIEDTKKHTIDDCEAAIISEVRHAAVGRNNWSHLASRWSELLGARLSFDQEVLNQLIQKGYIKQWARHYPRIDRVSKYLLSFLVSIGLMTYIHSNYIASSLPFSSEAGFNQLDQALALTVYLIPVLVIAFFFNTYFSVLLREWRRHAGRPRYATQVLFDIWDDIEGFREYLRVVEWEKLKETPDIDNKMLPYCLSLGFKINIPDAVRDNLQNATT